MPERVFICGAAKAGTNAVFEALGSTDGIEAPRVKEPGYFSPDIRGSQKVSTWVDYEALFSRASSHVLDGSVSYLLSDTAAADIVDRFPDARFIVCLRRQADMARSFHGQLRRNATESIPEFRLAWHAQAKRAAGEEIPATITEPRLLQYHWVCSIGSHVERLLRAVQRQQVLFIEHERLVTEPDGIRREIAEHLRIAASSVPPFTQTNEARQWRVDPYPVLRRLPPPVLSSVRRTKGALDRRGYPPTRLLRFGLRPTSSTSATGIDRGDGGFLRTVQESFSDDTERLRAATGLPLAGW